MSSPRAVWQEADDDSDSSESRMVMVDALEQMVADAQAADEDDDEDEDDEDFEDPDEDEDDDFQEMDEVEDDDFDIEDMEEVLNADLEGEEDDDDDDEEDDDDDDGDEQAAQNPQTIISELLQQVLSGRGSADTGEEGDSRTRSARAVRGIGISGLRQLLLAQGGFRLATDGDDSDDDDEDSANWYGNTRAFAMKDFWDPIEQPIEAGQELAYGGDFGKTPRRPFGSPPSSFAPSRNIVDRVQQRKAQLRRVSKTEMDDLIPNSSGTEVARYPARVYCGQYSEDSSFFYTCTQDFRVQMYDTTAASSRRVMRMEERGYRPSRYYTSFGTTQYTSLKPIKTIQGRMGNWTITDANLSPDNRWMIYSSITPLVHLVPTQADPSGMSEQADTSSDRQVALDFGAGNDGGGVRSRSGIWSIRFSGDSREIVAGAHFGDIYVYDIEARRRVLRVQGHHDDVNGVAFADSASSNVLISGSDDTFVKVWDRRSLSGGKPAGVLPGHTEGITYVAPKGDGRYCISNGKDQSLRLWDLRTMKSSEDLETTSMRRDYGLRHWDYRNMHYRKPRYQSHPEDCSVMTYRGHAVLKTLIRCHFSPEATTGQKYLYSGSADGRIHIWGLDGNVVQILDRNKAKSIFSNSVLASDPSAPEGEQEEEIKNDTATATGTNQTYSRSHTYGRASNSGFGTTVRDVSWHSSEPSIMSTAWDGEDGQRGSIAKHEWKGYGKGTSLEDAIKRSQEEENEGMMMRV